MNGPSSDLGRWLDEINTTYEQLHTAKEDWFWTAYMGLADDNDAARQSLGDAEIQVNRWLQDPSRLTQVRELLAQVESGALAATDDEKLSLEGWLNTFQAHAIESQQGRDLSEAVVKLEANLASARANMELGYQLADQPFQRASSVALSGMLRTDPKESHRRAAWEGLRSIEEHVLNSDFLEVVRERNRLARSLGGEDYYDWQTRRVEGMPKAEIFALLDELEAGTRDAAKRAVDELSTSHGSQVQPWNMPYLIAGDVTNELDPFFPFATSFEVWGRSFAGLGADYRQARLVLDLLDRPGKYENGFMHGPVPAWRTPTGHQAARIHFTANAIPTLSGAGQRGLETFFHEGGHAIHFANIDMPSPCFSQEFAPTSVAYAEIQSMIMDSLIGDADWMAMYARTRDNESIPFELIEKTIRAKQPFAAWQTRQMLVVPYAERALYELADDELTPERALEVCREVEERLLLIPGGSPRPVLSVPHLLAGESSAYYHGYILAEMGVEQTRRYLIGRDGYLVDNPRVAPTLCERYWQPGNRYGLHDYLKRMTGDLLSAGALAERVNRPVELAIESAKQAFERVDGQSGFQGEVELNASIAIVHGRETIADTDSMSFAEAAEAFTAWIDQLSTTSTT